MPELPEVETVRCDLEKNILGKKIADVITSDKKLRLSYPTNFINHLCGTKINCIKRRARYLLIELDNDQNLLVHLGMSGKIIFHPAYSESQTKKHDHCTFVFSDRGSLIYNDPRRFGLIDLVHRSKINQHPMLKNLGPEPLEKSFTGEYLQKKLRNKKMNIKTAMMDNEIVVGVGNIYINESLFRSRISPLRSASDLDLSELELLVKNIKNILQSAIQRGGSTLRDYVSSNGDAGRFQFDFKVYGRDNQNCVNCGGSIQRVKQNGRSTFFCTKCQK